LLTHLHTTGFLAGFFIFLKNIYFSVTGIVFICLMKNALLMDKHPGGLSDEELIALCRQGDKKSLESLIERYRHFIYNVSSKMTANRQDADDITQEVLIKVITKLDSFKGNSAFRTWLYKIMVNHILNYKKAITRRRVSFGSFGQVLDNAPDAEITAGEEYHADKIVLIEETKQTCMSGMLLCLHKKPRLVFILSELFGVNDKVGAEIMAISAENFRMILSRAKKDLYNFMHDKCGLINKNNPCRCAKKTRSFIEAGFVNPKSLRFTAGHQKSIEQVAGEKQKNMENLLENEYKQLYLQHSYLEGPDFIRSLRELVSSEKVNKIFNLKKNTL
jgi:RNA polymerase sigma factor (sigma-70 family)